MGEIVGAALVSHVPPIVLPEHVRLDMNGGKDISLLDALHGIRRDKLDALQPDTIVVFDTHWFTTIEHVVASHAQRSGLFTSDELPRGMRQMQYDFVGDPELAEAWAAQADGRDDTWIVAEDDPYLPVHYPTINLLPFLQGGVERWMSAGVCQTAEPDDFLLFGKLLADAVATIDRRVVLLASGGLSHRFWPLKQFRDHEGAGLEHIRTQEARWADKQVIKQLLAGEHIAVINNMDNYAKHAPEGYFGHYLSMVGALGGTSCTIAGEQYGDYEAVAGTGQVNIWFDV